jgi:carbamate kinase
MGLYMRLVPGLKPGEIMNDTQRRQLVRKLQMRKRDGGLGITSLRDVGEYAHVAALSDVLNAKSKVLDNDLRCGFGFIVSSGCKEPSGCGNPYNNRPGACCR